MCPPFESQRLELASDTTAVVPRKELRSLAVADAASLRRDLHSANEEFPDDALAAGAATARRNLSSPGQLLPGQGHTDLGAVPQWTSGSLHLAARRHRSRVLAALAHRLTQRCIAALSAVQSRWRQTRRAKAVYATLARLDHRTLRDLGLHRSDVGCVRPAPLDVWQDGPNVYDRISDTRGLFPR